MQHRVEGVEEFMIEKPGFEKFGVKMSLNPQGHRGFFLKALQIEIHACFFVNKVLFCVQQTIEV